MAEPPPAPRLRRAHLPCLPAIAALMLSACAMQPQTPERSPDDIRAEIARKLPASLADRRGWANDVYVALVSQDIPANAANICAVLAVTEQESTYQTNPPVPNLGRIAREEIYRRAGEHHVPRFAVDAALKMKSPDGRSYSDRIDSVRTEKGLNDIYVDMIAEVPLGKRLLAGLNPVHTAGPMQVSIDFAREHADGYPYPLEPGKTIRDEVFTRRGGLYFGTKHLLGYRTHYDVMLYRFADFNAGWYASRNAAFQAAVAKASGIDLQLDGDLLAPGASMGKPGGTERAVRSLGGRLGMDDRTIRRALQQADSLDFDETDLYRRVFELADRSAGRPLPRAVLPGIKLQSPKITRNLTTAWFANRVDARWKSCMKR
ncbi:DUF1615 domain-containing protein [Pseudoxanthomonas helianthi]|uniref:DUF1615 domain-containing protein n=1 Tax=Pseudoxanthomonas helianthi TaxID=1453541 RepID=A0A941ASK6_9GAMM|nr:DUF1615 domain-containing protein [Pseudoxanthomonas helianthi]